MIEAIERFWQIEQKIKLSHFDVHHYLFLLFTIWNSSELGLVAIETKELSSRLNTSPQNLKKSRERLKQAELINFIPGTTQIPNQYEIIGLESRNKERGTIIPKMGTFIPKMGTFIPKMGTNIPKVGTNVSNNQTSLFSQKDSIEISGDIAEDSINRKQSNHRKPKKEKIRNENIQKYSNTL